MDLNGAVCLPSYGNSRYVIWSLHHSCIIYLSNVNVLFSSTHVDLHRNVLHVLYVSVNLYVHAHASFGVGVITAGDVIFMKNPVCLCSKQSLHFTYSYAEICCQGNKVMKGCVQIPLNSMEVVREWKKSCMCP